MKIERYGVVALVFLVLTFVAATFWEDGETSANGDAPLARQETLPGPAASSGLPTSRVPEGPPLWRREAGEAETRLAANRAFAAGGARLRAQAEGRDAAAEEARRRRLEERGRRALRLEEEVAREVAGGVRGNAGGTAASPLRLEPSTAARERSAAPPAAERLAALEERARPRDQALPAAGGAAVPREPVGEAPRTVTVRPGDTLSEISLRALGTSKRWREIASLNGISDPSRLFVGQVLRLPGDAGVAAARPEPSRPPTRETKEPTRAAGPGSGRVVVRPGDTLSKLALAHLGDAERWREIAALNGITDPARLVVGQELVLPAGAAPAVRRRAPSVAMADASPSSRRKNRVQ